MNSTSPGAFALSATLHAALIALLLWVSHATSQSEKPLPIIELVAGAGDNFMAKEAPKLGTEGGVKVDIPKAPEPKPAPPEPKSAPPEPTPVTPAPQPKVQPKTVPPVPKAQDTIPDFKKQIKQDVRAAENKAKREIAKERAAEKKRADEEKKRLTKEEFDRANANKQKQVASVSPKSITAKQIDVAGITGGVVKGTGKAPGAGGKALTNDNADVLAAYDALFKQRLREKFEPPPGLSDTLKVTLQVRSNADGSLSNARIIRGSGVREFDQSVLEAVRRVQMPARPDKKSETIELNFGMRDLNEG